VWLHGGSKAAFDVLPLHNAHELPLGRGYHDARRAMLSQICPNVSERTVGPDRRWTWLHSPFHGGLGSRVQGVPLQQPEHDSLAVYYHALVPPCCLDTRRDSTDAVAGVTHGNVASSEIPNVGRAGVCALSRQTVGEPIRFAGNVIKELRKAQTFEPRRGSGAQVSLRVVAVDNHGAVPLKLCGRLAIELFEGDVDRPG
jgi:hypothetical protein